MEASRFNSKTTSSRFSLGAYKSRLPGILCVLIGLFLNKWAIERALSSDGHVDSVLVAVAILLHQSCWLIVGILLIRRHEAFPISSWAARVVILGLTALFLLGLSINARALDQWVQYKDVRNAWAEIVVSEELILAFTQEIKRLDHSLLNLELPDFQARSLFDASVMVADLSQERSPEVGKVWQDVQVTSKKWPKKSEQKVAKEQLQLWRPFLEDVQYFEHARFQIIEGSFSVENHDRFHTHIKFTGLARMSSGAWSAVDAKVEVGWLRFAANGKSEKDEWKIFQWQTDSFETQERDKLLFAEVLDESLLSARELERAQESVYNQHIVQYLNDPENFSLPRERFEVDASHPAVSVVDLNQDGLDDFYLIDPWTENKFYLNQGDGTFREIAAEIGLDLNLGTSAALFADYDNDGDSDVFIARSAERTVFLMNEDGKFVDKSENHIAGELPYFGTSLAAADYDGDGLLDIYISTLNGVIMLQRDYARERRRRPKASRSLLHEQLQDEDARKLFELRDSGDFHRITNVPGPPNVLLKNLGNGRFQVATGADELRLFRQTFQATWSDYDDDGDPDLYVANDYAPNNLFRNEGNGRFHEVTEETATADIGFGMGVSWGDYDNDGKHDLYISNMYSRAGSRITSQFPQLDPVFNRMARGNSLFHNVTSRFAKVSGLQPPALQVEKAGWSWGGQFIDVDNNGFLDIFALSGYYTAPKEIELPIDI